MLTVSADDQGEPSAWVKRFAGRIPPGTVLDVAAGGGRHVRFLRGLGYRVLAADRDVSRLGDFTNDDGVEVVEVDLESSRGWPFEPGKFQGVVVCNYLHRPLMRDLANALVPGGVLIYETFGAGNERFGRPKRPDFLLHEGELLEAYHDLEVLAYEHCVEEEPRSAVRQRICAVRHRW